MDKGRHGKHKAILVIAKGTKLAGSGYKILTVSTQYTDGPNHDIAGLCPIVQTTMGYFFEPALLKMMQYVFRVN